MKNLCLLLSLMFVMAACTRGDDNVVVNDEFYEYETEQQVVMQPVSLPTTIVNANMDRDIVVETDRNIIQMVGNPGTQYKYYVWTGGQDTNTDPDVIVDRGTVMVRTAE